MDSNKLYVSIPVQRTVKITRKEKQIVGYEDKEIGRQSVLERYERVNGKKIAVYCEKPIIEKIPIYKDVDVEIFEESAPKKELKEVLDDLVQYILSHFAVDSLIIGYVNEETKGFSGSISVDELKNKLGISISGNLNALLSSNYHVCYKGLEKKETLMDHYWIDQLFPALVTAIRNNSKEFDCMETIKMTKQVEGNASLGFVQGKGSYEKQIEGTIYISYRQQL